ncbi:MAG: glycerol kinase GlpK [Candidatus Omnitrophica bacterium]|nr:glycerol kinase GlpK [Candidatus Omnitrophota bacterium]
MSKYILAIDQGTTGSRAFIFDAKGRVAGKAYQEFKQYYPKPGWVEHDALEIRQSVENVIRRAVKESGINARSIAGIGITNQRETTIVWDRNTGKPLHRAIVWQDRRTADVCASPGLKRHASYIQSSTGLRLDPYFSATKIQWLLKHVPGLKAKAKTGKVCFGTVDSWLIYQLTGRAVHATDLTNASRTMLLNLRTKIWDPRLLDIFDVPAAMLPQVFPSGHVFGRTDAVAGLPAGIPICAVMGDQQAALYGQGCFGPGMIKNTYGTGCFMVLNTGNALRISKHGLLATLACDAHGKPVYALEGSVFIAGAVVQWLRDELKVIPDPFATEQAIAGLKDTAGVYFVPAFVGLGAPYWDPNARGIITGLTRGANARHIIRAAIESMAYQTKDVFDLMRRESGLKIKFLAVDGGACRNDFLMQFQADILSIPLMRPRMVDTTVAGAAHLAGVSAGVWPVKDLDAMRGTDKIFRPSMPSQSAKEKYAGWQAAVKRALL